VVLTALWVGLAGAASGLPSNCSKLGATVKCRYSYTGIEQKFVVPRGVSRVRIRAVGGKGGAGQGGFGGTGGAGGFGAVVSGTLSVKPGTVLYVEVAGNGTSAANSYTAGAGGFNGGGNGGTYGGSGASGGGGGASDVRTVSCGSSCNLLHKKSLASRLLVAGGGGGGGAAFNSNGGGGGSAGTTAAAGTGTDGTDTPGYQGSGGHGGGAGTHKHGGKGGLAGSAASCCPASPGADGAAGKGGSGQLTTIYSQEVGGGGGGGYYGGGSGGNGGYNNGQEGGGGGGGAGSSFAVSSITHTKSTQDTKGVPSVTFTYQRAKAAPAPPTKSVYNGHASGPSPGNSTNQILPSSSAERYDARASRIVHPTDGTLRARKATVVVGGHTLHPNPG
jgi:hypothetical protein